MKKKSGLYKILLGTGISGLLIALGLGLLLLTIIGIYTNVMGAIAGQESLLRARAGEPMGDGDLISVVDQALTYIGTPYVLGGESYRAIDCSGLSLVSYRDAGTGINLPHATYEQVKYGESIYLSGTKDYFLLEESSENHPALGEHVLCVYSESIGLSIPLMPGDLIFFSYGGATKEGHPTGHVGIYIGNGQYVHAINPDDRTYVSCLYNIYGGNFYPPTSVYAIRRILGTQSQSDFLEKAKSCDLLGYPITMPYADITLLAQYLQSESGSMREKYVRAIEIINTARTEQVSIAKVLERIGNTGIEPPDASSWAITRYAIMGFYPIPDEATQIV